MRLVDTVGPIPILPPNFSSVCCICFLLLLILPLDLFLLLKHNSITFTCGRWLRTIYFNCTTPPWGWTFYYAYYNGFVLALGCLRCLCKCLCVTEIVPYFISYHACAIIQARWIHSTQVLAIVSSASFAVWNIFTLKSVCAFWHYRNVFIRQMVKRYSTRRNNEAASAT